MGNKRNALIDMTRVAAAVGIVLCHVDLTGYGLPGTLLGQFLGARFSLMFFLAVIGFYVEKSDQAGEKTILKRVSNLLRIYGLWSCVYLAFSFVMLVLIQKMPLGQFLISRVKGFLFTGSYYHFWFYPAVIYTLLIIGVVKKVLGPRARVVLMPLAVALYVVGLLGTGYLPLGQQIPGLLALYELENFEALMHLFLLGFPAVIFGMAAANQNRRCPGLVVLIAAALYVAESMVLCFVLGWYENPQIMMTTPLLTVSFLRWAQNSKLSDKKINHSLCRVVSGGMYHVHPLILAAFAVIMPGMDGLLTFTLCVLSSAIFGWMLYSLRKRKFFALYI